jgi:outer membrane protein
MFRFIFALCAIALVPCITVAQAPKIGLVNTETIIKELPEAQEASKKLEDLAAKLRDTVQMMQKEFETRIEQYRKQEALMSGDAKRKEEETLNALRQRLLQFNEEKSQDLQRMREGFLNPLRDKVRDAVNIVAKEEKMTLVLDKLAGLVLYSEDKSDITFKVLDRMKRGGDK